MKKFLVLILTFSILSGCQSAQQSFSLKKKDNADEFLVKKKNPLVLPPNFNKLPIPGEDQSSNSNDEVKEFQMIIEKQSLNQGNKDANVSSIEETILKNINKNESN